jgi:putative transcriptional regulator
MQVRAGSLLIADPVHADVHNHNHVVLITESTSVSTMGITLNHLSRHDFAQLMQQQQIEWYGSTDVYIGGNVNPHALIMLHSNEWYSSNTLQVHSDLSISSDELMLEKMEMGNTPRWYRLFVGCRIWSPSELEEQLRGAAPKWLLLNQPSLDIVESTQDDTWTMAVMQCSQDLIKNYF